LIGKRARKIKRMIKYNEGVTMRQNYENLKWISRVKGKTSPKPYVQQNRAWDY
jgi:hypothetical protein